MALLYTKSFIEKLPQVQSIRNEELVYLLQNDALYAKKFIAQIEFWFKNLPADAVADMKARLRKTDDKSFRAAFFELMLHQFLIEEGFQVKVHELLGNKCPDFLVLKDGCSRFYMEVATIFAPIDEERADSNLNRFLQALDNIHHEYELSLTVDGILEQNLSFKPLIHQIKKWLDDLAAGKSDSPTKEFRLRDFRIKAEVISKRSSPGPIYRGFVGPAKSGDSNARPIEARISDKLKKYKGAKEEGLPLVIALCSGDDYSVTEHLVERVLFGQQRVVWDVKDPGSDRWERDRRGYFVPSGLGKVRTTSLSAVLLCRRKFIGDDIVYAMKLYHNPWAVHKLDKEIFLKIPQLIWHDVNKSGVQGEWCNNHEQLVRFD